MSIDAVKVATLVVELAETRQALLAAHTTIEAQQKYNTDLQHENAQLRSELEALRLSQQQQQQQQLQHRQHPLPPPPAVTSNNNDSTMSGVLALQQLVRGGGAAH